MEELVDLLLTFKEKPPEFASNGTIERSPIPGLKIEGIESPISFPLCSEQAKKIINVANESFVYSSCEGSTTNNSPCRYEIMMMQLFFLTVLVT